MTEAFSGAKWIWLPGDREADTYGEFVREFDWEQGSTQCRLSCDGDYVLYVNGVQASFWQYADYPHHKVFDSVDITPYLRKGKNVLAVRVWHYGENSQKYVAAQPGLIFEVVQAGAVLAQSDGHTRCRKSRVYANGEKKWITVQMGFSFSYDARQEDDWLTGIMAGGSFSEEVEKPLPVEPNPVQKMALMPAADAACTWREDGSFLIDLGQETVGIPVLRFTTQQPQTLLVQWGEDLQNGHVRRKIDARDFSFTYTARAGENNFTAPLLRIGCRYLEVFCQRPIVVDYLGVQPLLYPVTMVNRKLSDALDQKIYDTCVHTLRCCLMDHYVDTPWREQCLYAFDARNQMLCGCYAFADKNADYARANLKLMAQDRRADGLLSITYPCGVDLTIPGFSLYWFKAVREYMTHTGDKSLGAEVWQKLLAVMDVFLARRQDGLVSRFSGKNHWNFYDWSDHLEGSLHGEETAEPDLMLNCLFVIALEELSAIGAMCSLPAEKDGEILEGTRRAIRQAFFRPDRGLFAMTRGEEHYTALGNAMAVLAGVTTPEESKAICRHLLDGEMTACSLSMKTFLYDAMLQTDRAFYAPVVLDEIRRDYGKMLDAGATTVWETADGAAAFDNAGSLCHGWSAIPVYYYATLLGEA